MKERRFSSLVNQLLIKVPFSGWFIGDSEVDILAGKALGLKTCAVGFGLRNQDFIQSLNPDNIAPTPSSLSEFLNNL